MSAANAVECVVDGRNTLGESVIWHPVEQVLYWVDVRAPALYRLERNGSVTTIPLPGLAGAVVPRRAGGLAIALQDGFYTLDTRTGTATRIVDPEPDKPENRINDGRCDRAGRFWAGTMHVTLREPRGSLYRLDVDHTVDRIRSGITVPNSICFSPDDRTMYLADTYRDVIFAYDYALGEGTLSNERVFVDTASDAGHPDGSCVDEEGCVWNAQVRGGKVVRYTPDGRIDRAIALPVSQPTCCCFGGPSLETLFITSARQRIAPELLEREPLAGGLFAVEPGVRGLPEAFYGG
ncbi:MAG: SMP-30/gluconolactonase/LRE family protein [Burkholderiales bacterium]